MRLSHSGFPPSGIGRRTWAYIFTRARSPAHRTVHSHCDLWRSNHQQAGFPFCGKIDRLHVSWTAPTRSYSTLLPFSGVARNWLTSTTPYAVPWVIRTCRTTQSPTYNIPSRTTITIASWPSRCRQPPVMRNTPDTHRFRVGRCRPHTTTHGLTLHGSRSLLATASR